MIKLNDKDLFKLFDKHLRVFYPTFKDKPLKIEYIFDQKTVTYDYILRRLHFNSFILYFQFDGDHLRRLTYHEAVGMIKKEYPEAKINLELYIENKLNSIDNPGKFHENVNFYCDVEVDDVVLDGDQIRSMIDLALDTRTEKCNNEEWLIELSLKHKAFMKSNS